MEILIKCKSKEQAVDIAEHFLGSRPSEEFLNYRLFISSGECIDNATLEFQEDIIIVNID